jgi:thiamine pyrophosphate-dependent acetolactate synthase large subunit-like protein
MVEKEPKNGAEIIVECLKMEGVKFVFGVIGSAILDLLDVIYRIPEIRFIRAQHEQAGTFMADGYAKMTGEPGICTATCGPGVTNMVTGVAGAFQDSSPVIVLGGDIHTSHYGKGSSNFHEIDQENLFRPITKMSKRIEQVERIGEFMRMAFRVARSGRKGPVYLGIPRNIQKERADTDIWSKAQYRSETLPRGDERTIDRACELLLDAKAPVILAGGGVRWAKAESDILALAELMGIPVVVNHKGCITEDHPWSVGMVGTTGYPSAMTILSEADLVLTLGSTLNQTTTASYGHKVIPEGAQILQVDIDPHEIGKNFPVALGVVGDLKMVLRDMIEKLNSENVSWDREKRLAHIRNLKEQFDRRLLDEGAESDAVPINRLRLMRDLNKVLPKDTIMSAESGSTNAYHRYGFKSYLPLLEPGGLSCMGSGWCMAMGASLAYPDRPVVSVIGDGAFMMTLNELATAVDNNIPVVVVVQHNAVYGNVRLKQITHFESRFAASELYIPNLADVARSFGAHGERVEKPEEIIPAMERALASGKPAVLDVVIDASKESLDSPVKLKVKDRY